MKHIFRHYPRTHHTQNLPRRQVSKSPSLIVPAEVCHDRQDTLPLRDDDDVQAEVCELAERCGYEFTYPLVS